MTPQTRYHRHWHVPVTYGSLLYKVLRKPWITLDESHLAYVERSRLVWGVTSEPGTQYNLYTLSLLGLLHGLTGMTIRTK